jgi:predicted alpha-1,2-mannosidase
MKNNLILFLLSTLSVVSCSILRNSDASGSGVKSVADYVNPFIGTGGHGHTYPGATVPFGLVQLSPDTRLDGWDGCSGYHYSDSIIYGFSHTHLQGTGVSDYGDILIMPTNYRIKTAKTWNEAYKSSFKKSTEKASPGYYSVKLEDYQINTELTATEHVGIHKYSFAPGDSCRLFLDMMHRDYLKYYDIMTMGDTAVFGYRVSKGWAEDQHCYFFAVFNKPFKNFTQLDISYDEINERTGKASQVLEQVQVFSLSFDPTDELMVKVGISGTDINGAMNNMLAEAPHWNFEKYKSDAKDKWQQALSKAPTAETNKDELIKYYTALYHCYTVPNLWSDVDGRYRGTDSIIYQADYYKRYTVFSLWDTFRAYHPLMSVLEPERTRDWIHTFLNIYRERNETYCMIGYHSIPVIYDAYMRGIRDFDHLLALEAMKNAAEGPQKEKQAYNDYGYVPSDKFSESVSKTLEFAYDDWCIAQFAKELGDTVTYKKYIERAQNWKNVFDPKTKFMRARKNGGFVEPFDPYQVDFNYTEANAWQYSLFVPHDIATYIDMIGGPDSLEKWLDQLFTAAPKTTGREQADITGLIGQYAHGNEPSHHATFLYQFTNNPNKTEKYVKQIMQNLYTTKPDGLCGNEDCGQMSAWYVMAKNNAYSFLPGNPNFIPVSNSPKQNLINNNIINSKHDYKPNRISDYLITPIPIIQGPQLPFTDSTEVTIYCADPNARIDVTFHYRDKETNLFSQNTDTFTGEKKFIITDEVIINATAQKDGHKLSNRETCEIKKRNPLLKIATISEYDNQYTAGGREALIDGLRGGNDFRTGAWQGYQGKPLEVIVDLGEERQVQSVGLSCLEDTRSWIWLPSSVEIFVSENGQDYRSVGVSVQSDISRQDRIHLEVFKHNVNQNVRYVKVVAQTAFEIIPSWHLGAGGKPWIFADEIIIE